MYWVICGDILHGVTWIFVEAGLKNQKNKVMESFWYARTEFTYLSRLCEFRPIWYRVFQPVHRKINACQILIEEHNEKR